MAHRLKIMATPHKNVDGKLSKSRKDYRVIDRHRKNRTEVGTVHNKKDLVNMTEAYREHVLTLHARRNPNDRAFFAKHPDLVGVG